MDELILDQLSQVANEVALDVYLDSFILESNEIEEIEKNEYDHEKQKEAIKKFILKKKIKIDDIIRLTSIFGGRIRDQEGMNVKVGSYIPPRGGAKIVERLKRIISVIDRSSNPYLTHRRYQKLHPFTDGNGRSGRAIWLRMMYRINGVPRYGFLHSHYYQALENGRN